MWLVSSLFIRPARDIGGDEKSGAAYLYVLQSSWCGWTLVFSVDCLDGSYMCVASSGRPDPCENIIPGSVLLLCLVSQIVHGRFLVPKHSW